MWPVRGKHFSFQLHLTYIASTLLVFSCKWIQLKRVRVKCLSVYKSKAWLFLIILSFGILLGCITVYLLLRLFVFSALSQRRLIQSLCWQLLWKDGADIFYQTLLKLLTRPWEMCCIDCRQRTLWNWNKKDDTLVEPGPSRNLSNALCSCQSLSPPHTQTVKPGFKCC